MIGLISKSYEFEISAYNPEVTRTHPTEALKTLEEEITRKSDAVVGVFHGAGAEARELAEKFPRLSVLVLAQNEAPESDSATPIVVRDTTIVINPAKGDAVGVLDFGFDPFCGCATACIAAAKLGREWVGIDISPKAAELVKIRIERELTRFC